MIKLDDVRNIKCSTIKFVRVAGEYRFCEVEEQHRSLVKPEEKALSAGIIAISNGYFKLQSGWSFGLDVGVDEHEEERLELVLKKKYKNW